MYAIGTLEMILPKKLHWLCDNRYKLQCNGPSSRKWNVLAHALCELSNQLLFFYCQMHCSYKCNKYLVNMKMNEKLPTNNKGHVNRRGIVL